MGEAKTVEKGQIWKQKNRGGTRLILRERGETYSYRQLETGNELNGYTSFLLDYDTYAWSLVGLELEDGRRVMVGERFSRYSGKPGALVVDEILPGAQVAVHSELTDGTRSERHVRNVMWLLNERTRIGPTAEKLGAPFPTTLEPDECVSPMASSVHTPKSELDIADALRGLSAHAESTRKTLVELNRVFSTIGESESFRRAAEDICNGTPPIVFENTKTVDRNWDDKWSLWPRELAQAETLRATRPRAPEQRAREIAADLDAGALTIKGNAMERTDNVLVELGDDDEVSAKLDFSTYTIRDADGNVIAAGPLTNGGATYWTPKDTGVYKISVGSGQAEAWQHVDLVAGETVKIPPKCSPPESCDAGDSRVASRKLIDNAIRAYAGPHPRAYLSAMVAMGEIHPTARGIELAHESILALEGYLQRGFSEERARSEAAKDCEINPASDTFDLYLRERNRK